ncbi:transcriptional regulator [Maribacter sp. 4U21]|uniref:GyrI-like domain-containing protein n=1 Tax=Maribacter sp. 4U21 TaxID=1889779 RepID=UPI000C14CE9E|nr:GyrI-like domain-containing protein [Maribacter sp. 4U21]PIB30766.1 transcriptional regulator [Maribacter sp. 4U21]
MKKTILTVFGILLIIAVWYFFIKSHDYQVNFTIKALPGTINQSVKTWNRQLKSEFPIVQSSLTELQQKLKFSDSVHTYNWSISMLNDSVSKVKIYARDDIHSYTNKLLIPFVDTDFEKRTRKSILDFSGKLKEHLNKFKVTIVGEEDLKSTFCAYIQVKGTQYEKANGMMLNYPLLDGILSENKVQLNGMPFVEVVDWNMSNDSITYNFCYPIVRSENLPVYPELKYKRFFGKKALKAIYNGNYITSDRAWYALLKYARNENIAIKETPIEYFFNNPNMGGNELEWKAEVYLPIEETYED